MNKYDFANMLNGTLYGKVFSTDIFDLAKKHGLVVIHGISDDLIEIDGALSNELDVYNKLHVEPDELYFSLDKSGEVKYFNTPGEKRIHVIYDKEITWNFETDIENAAFYMLLDKKVYTKGIVINLNDLEDDSNINFKDSIGDWKLKLLKDHIEISFNPEARVYDIKDIVVVKQNDNYVFLYKKDGSYYQIKFEEDAFLSIDLYDAEDDFVDTIGCWTF